MKIGGPIVLENGWVFLRANAFVRGVGRVRVDPIRSVREPSQEAGRFVYAVPLSLSLRAAGGKAQITGECAIAAWSTNE